VVANLCPFSLQEELEQLDRALLTKLKFIYHPQLFDLLLSILIHEKIESLLKQNSVVNFCSPNKLSPTGKQMYFSHLVYEILKKLARCDHRLTQTGQQMDS
jgi:hypothetical protein